MTQYRLVKKGNAYYVAGLADTWCDTPDTMLMVRYPAGDADTVARRGEPMHRALYDLYQTCEGLHDGDEFALRGKVVYRCEGIHVVPA
jgi:hypothetical protein